MSEQPAQRVTIQEVARAVGVSASTVSVVLNGNDRAVGIREATRAAVLEASRKLGYHPNHAARSLRRKSTRVISLLLQDLANPCFVDIAVAVRAAARERGFEVNVVDAGPESAELRALDYLQSGVADGVIVATGRHSSRPAALGLLKQLVDRGMAAVVLLDRSPDPRVPAIRVDVEYGARLAVRHLLKLGHREIAHLALLGKEPIEAEQSSRGDRYRGWHSTLTDAGIEPDPNWLVEGSDTLAGGYMMMQELLDNSPVSPTATLVYNDLTAIGALRALRERDVTVPGGMALVGTDGISLGSYTTPSLTTIDHPRTELGQRGVETLCALLDGQQSEKREILLQPQLVVRESCGARKMPRHASAKNFRRGT